MAIEGFFDESQEFSTSTSIAISKVLQYIQKALFQYQSILSF
jgi:hypothetical protein